MKVSIVNKSQFDLPSYATAGSAGMDLRADLTRKPEIKGMVSFINSDRTQLDENNNPKSGVAKIILFPQSSAIIKTGIFIQLPDGYEARIQPRSGLSFKKGLSIMNSPGCIDSDFTGDIGIIVANLTDKVIEIEHGERVAQMVVSKYEKVSWETVEELNKTERGTGGFGHSGSM